MLQLNKILKCSQICHLHYNYSLMAELILRWISSPIILLINNIIKIAIYGISLIHTYIYTYLYIYTIIPILQMKTEAQKC